MDNRFKLDFLKGSVATSMGTMSSIVFHFISVMIMTRYLPKNEFGLYILILVIVHCLTILGGLGLDLTLVKFITGETATEKHSVFWHIVTARVIFLGFLGVTVFLIGHLLVSFVDKRVEDYLLLIPIMFLASSFRDLFYSTLQGLKQFTKYASVQTLSAIMRFLLIVVFLKLDHLSVRTLIYIEIFVPLCSITAQLILIPFNLIPRFKLSVEKFTRVIRFGIPLYLNSILTLVIDRANIFIIGAFLTLESIAIYDVADKIPQGFVRIFRSFIIVYFPNLSKLFSDGKEADAQKIINRSLVLFSFGISLAVFFVFLFRKEIILLLFSESYLGASLALPLLMFNFYLRAISNIMGYSLVSAGYSSVPVKTNTVSSATLIAGSFVAIPLFGIMGAICSLLLMNIVSQTIYYYYFLKFGIKVGALRYLKPLFLMLILSGAYTLLGMEALFLKLAFLLAYICLCRVIVDEFSIITDMFGKLIHHLRPASQKN